MDECKPLCGGAGAGDADVGQGSRVPGPGPRHGMTVQAESMKIKLKAPGAKRLKLNYDDLQVEQMKIKLKAPGTKRLKPNDDVLLSSFAFNFNSRRYTMVATLVIIALPFIWLAAMGDGSCGAGCALMSCATVGRCRLTLSYPS